MFKRLRTLRVSLATKCQILFGAAAVLIIGAALLVPWQRMEQLTDQINTSTAKALCDQAISEHTQRYGSGSALWSLKSSGPTTHPVTAAHLILLERTNESQMAGFERRAIKQFEDHPDTQSFAHLVTPEDGSSPKFYYVRPLRAEAGCLQCHQPLSAAVAAPGSFEIAAHPTTQKHEVLVGAVAVDMQSRVDTNQLLLNRIIMLAAGLMAGILATAVFYFITTRIILQPVRVLQETAEKVSEGDLNIRSHISTGDEFETLAKTFNVMLGNLQGNQDQLRQINKSLDLKLNQLAESNVALYESNRLKSEFLANVSHELRTPLNSILGFAELLKDMSEQADARSSRYVQNILSSGRNLLELINDLLDLAKIEAGKMEIRSEPLSLSDLFEGLIGLLKPLSEKQQVTIDHTVAADVPVIYTDSPKLQQVLYNFLSNAIKFSPANGRVEMRAEMEGAERVRLSVTDSGPGIDVAHQQVIFEKFRQIDGSVTRQHGGTGLGLAISKELVALLHGSIGVVSEVGKGATFWVTLPLKIESGPQEVRMNLVLT